MDTFYQRAYSLISSPEGPRGVRHRAESRRDARRYGRNQAGQRMLMARRLVEAGVRFVTLTYGGWDHHDNIEGGMRAAAARLGPGLRRPDPRPRRARPARIDAGHA